MAQNFEYPMWSPHEKAKLYKRYTGESSVELKDSDVITIQQNRYVFSGRLKWVEATSKEENDEQPVSGLLVGNEYITIRTNSLKKFSVGDIIELPANCKFGGMWTITDGISVEYAYTPKQVQTFQNLPLSSLG